MPDREGDPATRWQFRRVRSSRYEMPARNAERSAVATETLELARVGMAIASEA